MTQWCIEEAVMERLYWQERLDASRRPGGVDVVTPFEQAGADHAARMAELLS